MIKYIVACILLTILFIFLFKNLNLKKNIYEKDDTKDKYSGYADDPLILAKKNAANISFLNSQIKKLMNINEEIHDLSGQIINNSSQIKANSTQVKSLYKSIQGKSLSNFGTTTPISKKKLPVITGTTTTDDLNTPTTDDLDLSN